MTDVTDATFETEVLARSEQVPVVVDLWAEWCGPCRVLGPIIEKVVSEKEGAVALAKVDVDRNPKVAAAFAVQSIPAVFAIKDRKVVDQFVGALPERSVEEFVSRLAPTETEADKLVALGDEESLRKVLEDEPGNPAAVVGLAELMVSKGDSEEALSLLSRIPETAETRRVAALARLGEERDLLSEGVETRLETLLDSVKEDESARQEFLDLLEAMGADDPRTAQFRRALTARLF